MQHSQQHEDTLQRILLHELDASTHEARALLDECPECRELLSELHAASDGLERLAHEERATYTEALATIGAADRERAQTALAPIMATRPGRRSSLTRTFILRLGAAAAGLLIVVIGARYWLTAEPPVRRMLGASGAIICAPQSSDPSQFKTFTFEYSGHRDGVFYRIVVESDDPSVTSAPISSPRLEVRRWGPTEADWSRFPETFRWQVTAYDALNEPLDFGVGNARRER